MPTNPTWEESEAIPSWSESEPVPTWEESGPYKPGAYRGEPVGIPAEVIAEAEANTAVDLETASKALTLRYDRLRTMVGDDPEKLASLNEAYVAMSRGMGVEPVGIGRFQPMERVSQEQVARAFPELGDTGAGVVSGVQRAAAGLSEGIVSPEGFGAFVPGAVGKAYGKGFLGSMVASVPEQVKAFSEALGAKDVSAAVEAGITLGATGLFVKGGLSEGKTKTDLEAKKAEVVKALEENNAPLTAAALEAKPIELPEAAKPEAVKETPAESKPAVEAVASAERVSETIPVEPETVPSDSGTNPPFIATGQADVPIGPRKALVDELRDAEQLSPIPENAPYKLQDVWDDAAAVRALNPLAPEALAQSVIATPRMLEGTEVGLLTMRLKEIQDGIKYEASQGNFQEVSRLMGEKDNLHAALRISGGQASKGLNAFRFIIKDDFSLDTMLMREQASMGRKLDMDNPADVKRVQEIEAISKEIESKQKELDEASAIAEEAGRMEAAERAVASLSGESRPLRQGKLRMDDLEQGKRGADILDNLDPITKTIDPKLIKEANPNWKPHKDLKKLFREGGMKADEAITGLGLDMKPDAFGEALNAAARARRGNKTAARNEQRLAKQEERAALIDSKIAQLEAMAKAEHEKIFGRPVTTMPAGITGLEGALSKIPNIVSWIKIGAAKAGVLSLKGLKGFDAWQAEMQATYGHGLDPHLNAIYRASLKEARKQARELKKGTLDLSPAERRANTLKQARETAAEEGFDKNVDLGRYAKQLAKQYISEGITKMGDVVEAVHADLLNIVPDFTRAETMDAISDYGKVRALDNNPVNKRARQLRTEIQMTRKLSDALSGEMPKKTGQQREPSTVLTRQLQKQLKDVMAEQGMNQKDPAKQLASALDAKKNAIRNRIAEIKDELATGKRLVRTDKGEIKLDAEGEALQAELDALKKQREDIFGKDTKKPLTDEQKLERATRAAEKSLQEWTKRAMDAAEGKFEKKGKPAKTTSAEIKAIEAHRDAAKAEYEELKALANPKPSVEEMYVKRRLTALTRQESDYQSRIARGDFDVARPKKASPALSKVQQEAIDKKTAEVEILKQDWQRRQEQAIWDKMSPAGKGVRTLFNTYDAARLIQTTGEMSYILRQGKWTALSNPLLTSKAVIQSLKALVGSRERTMALDEAVFSHPESAQAMRDGLYLTRLGERSLTKQEEFIMGRWAESMPAVKNFTQAAHVFMNKLRFDLWRRMKDDLSLTPEESKQLAMFVNESTGRGGLGKRLEPAAVALGRAMYSPRFFVSRWQLLTGHSLWGGTSLSRKIIATQYAKSLAGLGLYYAALHMYFSNSEAQDGEIETDFRSAKGGKVQVGDTVIDPLAGLAQAVTLAQRTISLETMNRSGEVTPLRNPEFGKDSWRDVASRYAWSKAHPVPGTIASLFSGTDLGGNEATLETQAANYFMPITYFDIYHALKDQGYSDQAALALLGFLGEGLQTYR